MKKLLILLIALSYGCSRGCDVNCVNGDCNLYYRPGFTPELSSLSGLNPERANLFCASYTGTIEHFPEPVMIEVDCKKIGLNYPGVCRTSPGYKLEKK